MSDKVLWKGALLLTAAGVFGKILSAGYRVPFQNMVGDEGFYIYQQIYPFITIAWLLSIYGFPAAISKLVIELEGQKSQQQQITFHLPIFVFLFMINFLLFVCLYVGAEQIARGMGDVKLQEPIQYASFLFLIIPFTSFIRGGFQSTGNMRPTAFSQTAEQLVRVFFILLFTYLFVKQGKNLYEIGSGAAFASSIGVFVGIIILVIYIFYFTKRKQAIRFSYHLISYRKMAKVLLQTTVIMSLNYMLLVFLQLVDNFTMISTLQQYGLSLEDAKVEKGIFDRGQPLVQLGVVFGSSLALALVPSVAKMNSANYQQTIYRVLKLTILFSLGATVGLIAIFPSVNIVLFETSLGNEALRIFSVLIVIVSLTLTLSTYLQGLGFVKRQALLFGITLMVKWILNQLLIPYFGITGSAIASVISVVFLVVSFFVVLKKQIPIPLRRLLPWKSTILSIMIMLAVVTILHSFFDYWFVLNDRLDYWIVTLFSCLFGALAFFYTLLVTKAFSEEELKQIPFGEQLLRILYRRKDK
ncbi:PST family polysaccharide transporter [Salirhabdus euzebyi]|uniref:PST family polysaccharide transporter n=1 Tax=Salirhabdus euzebyi TaxID=394506 RepID=A0A841QA08_9BACI|nr:oligosaccharide flippase family protein [Salirhabdus euzebyi]MBB6455250.1 PST family polysaccharide transporter [Salirhabdus euzebyi]